ncbi:MAG: pilus assembly protein [Pseudomonadota bacterium]
MWRRVFQKHAQRFARETHGAALLLTTICITVIFGVTAIAIDYGQALVLKGKLRNAADAAALVVGSRPNITQAQADTIAGAYIRANYPDLALGTMTNFSVQMTNTSVDVVVTANLATTFLKILGTDSMTVSVNSRSSRNQGRLELVLALDNTGSMCNPDCTERLDRLKEAAETLVNILFGDNETSEDVRIALVPFSAAVNLGNSALGRGWIDETGLSPLNSEDTDLSPTQPSLLQLFDAMVNVPWGGCVRARTGGLDVTDTPPDASIGDTLWVPYFAPDEQGPGNASSYFNDYIPDTGGERNPDRYIGQSLSQAQIDSGRGPNSNCVVRPVLPLTNVKSTITTAIQNMTARGSTVIPTGLSWAWRLISPGEPYTEGAPYTEPNVSKAIVLLTDGRNQVERGAPYYSWYSAYGFARSGHMGATDGSESRTVLNTKAETICSNIRADKDGDPTTEDIFVYTIAFRIDSGSETLDNETRAVLQNCATPAEKCPGEQCFYDSPAGSDLTQIFSKIAIGLNGLRISK